MTVQTNLAGADNEVLQAALSAYSDEAYTTAKKLSGTGIVGTNDKIDVSTETFKGQVRWDKPLNPAINVASLTDSTDGTKTTTTTDFLTYIKTVRTHGAEKVNMKEVVTQRDGLAKIAKDFGETRSQDEHNAILSVLKGVAISEALRGAAEGNGSGSTGLGGQTFDNDPADGRYGFYVDLGSAKMIADHDSAAASAAQGAQRAQGFLNAFGQAYKDHEPDYAYLVTSPQVMASLRAANLVDQTKVTDGSIDFQTIFGGKFRLIQTRASQGIASAGLAEINTGVGVDIVGAKTSFLVLPGSIAMKALEVPVPVEIERDAAAYMGGGTTQIWYRWGYVLMPAGYDWIGADDVFPSDANYFDIKENGTQKALSAGITSATALLTTGVWQRKAASALSLGILPIFHS